MTGSVRPILTRDFTCVDNKSAEIVEIADFLVVTVHSQAPALYLRRVYTDYGKVKCVRMEGAQCRQQQGVTGPMLFEFGETTDYLS